MENSINLKNITYKEITEVEEVVSLVKNYFYDIFRENHLDYNTNVDIAFEEGSRFFLFEIDNNPCALIQTMWLEYKKAVELLLIEVIDTKVCLRGKGIGRQVINIIKNEIFKDESIVGYSIPEAIEFWAKVAKEYDEYYYNEIKTSYDEEEECYTSDFYMDFVIQ